MMTTSTNRLFPEYAPELGGVLMVTVVFATPFENPFFVASAVAALSASEEVPPS